MTDALVYALAAVGILTIGRWLLRTVARFVLARTGLTGGLDGGCIGG